MISAYGVISVQHSLSTSLSHAPQIQLGYALLSRAELASVSLPKLIQASGTMKNCVKYILLAASPQSIDSSTMNQCKILVDVHHRTRNGCKSGDTMEHRAGQQTVQNKAGH